MRERLFRKKDEHGSAELISFVLLVPFMIFFVFALIDMTFYMQTRSNVQEVLRDGTRTVALYGGNSQTLPLNKTGQKIEKLVENRLWSGGACVVSHCTVKPVVKCTPEVASTVGTTVACSVTYGYSPVVFDGFFGFSQITSTPFELTESSISETGYGG